MRRLFAPMAVVFALAIDSHTPYERAAMSTVIIRAGEGVGSGVFVLDGTHILTAHHIVEFEADIRAHPPIWEGGSVVGSPGRYSGGMRCRVAAVSPGKDLALLEVEGRGTPMLPGRSPSAGDPAFVVGHGGNAPFNYNAGSVRQVFHDSAIFPARGVSARMVETSINMNVGDSGSPLVDRHGCLIGIASYIETDKAGVSKCIHISEILEFLGGR